MSIFLSVYPDLVHSVKPDVMTVADHCYSFELISQNSYDQLIQRDYSDDAQKARHLLGNVRTVLVSRPLALKEFVTVLFKVRGCDCVARKIQKQLQ